MDKFAEKLKQLREAAKLSQEAVARTMGMSVGIIRDYEQGKKKPSLRAAFKLADALGVDVKVFKDSLAEAEEPPAKATRKRKGE
jgi:transcriptional regulator with XRE-family HTH domain